MYEEILADELSDINDRLYELQTTYESDPWLELENMMEVASLKMRRNEIAYKLTGETGVQII